MASFPLVPDELLRELEKAFPDRLPDTTKPPHEMGVLIGQQKVIRFLREKNNEQQELRLLQGKGV